MDLSTGLQAETVHTIHHTILDQITGIATTIPVVTTHTTDRPTTETTIETEDSNRTQDMTKETRTTKTGMITIKIETGSTTEDDQKNTNTTGTSQRHKSHSNTQIKTSLKLCKW